MIKKFLIFTVCLLCAGMMISCGSGSDEVACESPLASVSFGVAEDGEKVISIVPSTLAIEDLYWCYTAEWKGDSGVTPVGQELGQKSVKDGQGLSDATFNFTPGDWEFKLYAYTTEDEHGNAFTKDVIYSGTSGTVTITLGGSTTVNVPLDYNSSSASGGKGTIALGAIDFKDGGTYGTLASLTLDGTERSGDLSDNQLTNIAAGKHTVYLKYTNSTSNYYEGKYRVVVCNGMVTTISGTMDNKKSTVPPGALTGSFSVSETAKVNFSKGNLQYQASTGTWQFAEHQYDRIGNAAGNNTSSGRESQSAWIDLFGWGATGRTDINSYLAQPYSVSTTNSDYKTEASARSSEVLTRENGGDWGVCMGEGWRTLTKDEWKYLISTRNVNGGTGEGKSYRYATINSDGTGVYGLILYPDDYTSQTSATSYTSAKWSAMEAAGAVFLPAAGYRNGTSVDGVGDYGYYWSSAAVNSYYAYLLYFGSGGVNPAIVRNRDYGHSVRLVCGEN